MAVPAAHPTAPGLLWTAQPTGSPDEAYFERFDTRRLML